PFAARLELGRAPGGPLAQLERAQLLLDQRLVVGPVLGERLEPGQLGPRPVDAIVALAGVDQALIEQRELVLAGDPLLAGAGLLAEDPLALGQRRGQLTVELAGAVELGREPASALAGAAAGLLELGQPGPQLAELDLDVRQVAAQELELGAALGQLGVAALASGDAIADARDPLDPGQQPLDLGQLGLRLRPSLDPRPGGLDRLAQLGLADVPAQRRLGLAAPSIELGRARPPTGDRGLELGAGIFGEDVEVGVLATDQRELGLGLLGPLERRATELTIEAGAGHPLEQLGPLAAAGLEERRELPLGEQHRASELIEVEAQPGLDRREHVALAIAGDDSGLFTPASRTRTVLGCACARSDTLAALGPKVRLAGAQVDQLHLLVLDPSVGPATRSTDLPARPPAAIVDAQKVDLGPALAGAVTEDPADVVLLDAEGRILVLAADHHAAAVGEARGSIEQRQTHRVEQRGLAGSGRAGDRDQSRAIERRPGEVDLEVAGQAREVLSPDRQNLHRAASSSRWTASRSSW